jgi:hypothetical protein
MGPQAAPYPGPAERAPKRLSRLLLHRRDSIGTAYHVLTFQADAHREIHAGHRHRAPPVQSIAAASTQGPSVHA